MSVENAFAPPSASCADALVGGRRLDESLQRHHAAGHLVEREPPAERTRVRARDAVGRRAVVLVRQSGRQHEIEDVGDAVLEVPARLGLAERRRGHGLAGLVETVGALGIADAGNELARAGRKHEGAAHAGTRGANGQSQQQKATDAKRHRRSTADAIPSDVHAVHAIHSNRVVAKRVNDDSRAGCCC